MTHLAAIAAGSAQGWKPQREVLEAELHLVAVLLQHLLLERGVALGAEGALVVRPLDDGDLGVLRPPARRASSSLIFAMTALDGSTVMSLGSAKMTYLPSGDAVNGTCFTCGAADLQDAFLGALDGRVLDVP